ncbi:MAG: DNA repair protein RadA [Acidimicrobiia bacterium]
MAKTRTIFRCTECGSGSPKWVGRCPGCESWNTLVEEIDEPRTASSSLPHVAAVSINAVIPGEAEPRTTGISELDRVLSGGLVPGSVTLLHGEPGIGKSTLLIDVAARWSATHGAALYVTAEESAQQVQRRAERIGAMNAELYLLPETSLGGIVAALDELRPSLVVLDSIQTVFDPELSSAPGSVAQVRECAHRLVRLAKDRGLTVVLVGHVTKDGAIAGPRVLEHVVDTVLSFEGERHHALRLLRAAKHRFGTTSELGLFEMGERGLADVPDPSKLFLTDRRPGLPGSVVVPTLEGHRPLLVEVQALVAPTQLMQPRRSAQGLDSSRLAMVLAVLENRSRVSVVNCEIYASVVGGVRLVEPGADLAVALAVASSAWASPLSPDMVVCGELGLGGELRQVSGTARRLAEAARLGFKTAIVPASAPSDVPGIELRRAATLEEALVRAGLEPLPTIIRQRRGPLGEDGF